MISINPLGFDKFLTGEFLFSNGHIWHLPGGLYSCLLTPNAAGIRGMTEYSIRLFISGDKNYDRRIYLDYDIQRARKISQDSWNITQTAWSALCPKVCCTRGPHNISFWGFRLNVCKISLLFNFQNMIKAAKNSTHWTHSTQTSTKRFTITWEKAAPTRSLQAENQCKYPDLALVVLRH